MILLIIFCHLQTLPRGIQQVWKNLFGCRFMCLPNQRLIQLTHSQTTCPTMLFSSLIKVLQPYWPPWWALVPSTKPQRIPNGYMLCRKKFKPLKLVKLENLYPSQMANMSWGLKWIYKINYLSEESIEIFKVGLVAEGYSHRVWIISWYFLSNYKNGYSEIHNCFGSFQRMSHVPNGCL